MKKRDYKELKKIFTPIEVFDKKKLNPRPCGACGEEDTMLICCECLRIEIEKKLNKQAQNNLKHITKIVKMALDTRREKEDLFILRLKDFIMREVNLEDHDKQYHQVMNKINELDKEVFAKEDRTAPTKE